MWRGRTGERRVVWRCVGVCANWVAGEPHVLRGLERFLDLRVQGATSSSAQ